MDLGERKKVQASFAGDTRILISTDAGGEGLNLQFCHVIVNYDMPWNPMRMEQRIGRVDRIGQPHVVRALNLVLEDTVEHRVRDVLETKLQVILEEFGVDKTSDVLDSAEANHLFDELFMEALTNPEVMDQELAKALQTIQNAGKDKKSQDNLFYDGEQLLAETYQKTANHPLPHWVSAMVEQYLLWQNQQGIQAKFDKSLIGGLDIIWPDGALWDDITFVGKDAQQDLRLKHITLENPKVRGLCTHLPIWSDVQSIPVVKVPTLPTGASGYWSLWSVRFAGSDERQVKYLPIYIKPDGSFFAPASNRIWDALCSDTVEVISGSSTVKNSDIYQMLRAVAEEQGKLVFEDMLINYKADLSEKIDKGEYSFAARKRAIERIGLPEVKNYRLRQLVDEELNWAQQIKEKQQVYPELSLHIVFEIKG